MRHAGWIVALSCLLATALSTGAGTWARQAPGIPQAIAAIQKQDWDGAIAILEPLTKSQPENPRVWSLLGLAYHSKKELDKALAAHLKAAEFPQTRPAAYYNIAMVYALKGQKDRAFEWLEKARATKRVDLTQVGADADAAGLRDDPRYASLFPTKAEFADPFVEPTVVIREWDGESPNDQFGWIARNIGDVDQDGVADVATSAPTRAAGGKSAGAVYAYSTGTGKLLWSADGHPGDQLGLGIEAAGDVDKDGVPDVIASAPGGDKAYLYSGRSGKVLRTLDAPQKGEAFGRHVSDVGDQNGDGYADVIVGAPLNDAGGEDVGRAYVYSGKDGTILLTLTGEQPGDQFGAAAAGSRDGKHAFLVVGAPNAGPNRTGRTYVYKGLTDKPAFVIESDDTGAQLGGMFVSVVGDVDADGTPDIYASDWPNSAKGRSTGRIYVHSGATGRRLLTLTGEAEGDGFGIGPADAGDVDGDGHADLVIGAWQYAGAAASGGKVYLYSGKDGSLIRAWTGKVMGETLGFDATGLGDVDGDGTIDLLVTSAWSALHGTHSGRVFVISSQPARIPR
jgi:hypothetical protein